MNLAPIGTRVSSEPKVSVCVITYNQERYIGRCLQSLVAQKTSFDFEIIVGDDSSTDGTRAIILEFVKLYPHIVRTRFQEKNTGGSRNNLEVHASARGVYVAHVDGDDYVLPGKLQAQADALDLDPTCTAVWHRVDYFDDSGWFCSGVTADMSSFRDGRVRFEDVIRLGFVGVFSSLMYRRAARTQIDPRETVLDLYFTWDLLSKGGGRVLDNVFGRYRVASTGSLTMASRHRVQTLALAHAEEFLASNPARRQDFMIWALSQTILGARPYRHACLRFLKIAWMARSMVTPLDVYRNLQRTRRIQVQWRKRLRSLDPAHRGG